MASNGRTRQTKVSYGASFIFKTQIYFQAYVSIFAGIFSVYAHVIDAHKTGSSNNETSSETAQVEAVAVSNVAQLAQDDLDATTIDPGEFDMIWIFFP